MGLDIALYIGISKSPVQGFDEYGEPIDRDGIRFWANPDFPGREAPIDAYAVYRRDDARDVYHSSYGTYTAFRNLIRQAMGYGPDSYQPGLPFMDMLMFSDCEGVLGPDLCRTLADDFATHSDRVLACMEGIHAGNYLTLRDGLVAGRGKDCALRFA